MSSLWNSFPAELKVSLVAVFSHYGARCISSSDTLKNIVVQASKYIRFGSALSAISIVLSVRKYMFSSYSQPVMHFLQQCAKSSTSRGY